jgi:small subunit ribosomal protein S6
VIRYLTVKQDGPVPAPRSGPVPTATSDAAALETVEA